ncbi:MAG: MoaD/ThiS family protein [Rhodospirillales bacterium]|nr:MoaD/ThiS family protein [Rhodospirillales bacterium]
MKITLKTAGLFSRYLPEGTKGNLAELEVKDGATPVDVARQIGAPTDTKCLIVVNGTAVPPSQHDIFTLNDGDAMSFMPPLKGG